MEYKLTPVYLNRKHVRDIASANSTKSPVNLSFTRQHVQGQGKNLILKNILLPMAVNRRYLKARMEGRGVDVKLSKQTMQKNRGSGIFGDIAKWFGEKVIGPLVGNMANTYIPGIGDNVADIASDLTGKLGTAIDGAIDKKKQAKTKLTPEGKQKVARLTVKHIDELREANGDPEALARARVMFINDLNRIFTDKSNVLSGGLLQATGGQKKA